MKNLVKRRKHKILLTIISLSAIVLAACGGNSESSTTNGMTDIDVGILPITSDAALALGVENGIFEKHDLNVTTHIANSGAALVPAVLKNQYQFGHSNNLSLVLAHAEDQPVRIVSNASGAGKDPEPTAEALIVPEDASDDPADLNGKRIAVNGLNNTQHMATMNTIEKNGGDPDTIEFLEIGFPDMVAGLKQGQIDAADISEPQLTQGLEDGMKKIAIPYRDVEQGLPVSSQFTSADYLKNNKDVVKRFAEAMDEASEYANDHQDEVAEFMVDFIDMDPSLADKVKLMDYPEGSPSVESLENLADLAQKYGILDTDIKNMDSLVGYDSNK